MMRSPVSLRKCQRHMLSRSMRDGTVVGQTTKGKTQLLPPFTLGKNTYVGVPRNLAHTMIFQSMQGTATMLQGGMHPAILRYQGTSPEGCAIGGLVGMEEASVCDHVGGAWREAATLARLMETTPSRSRDIKFINHSMLRVKVSYLQFSKSRIQKLTPKPYGYP